MRSAIGLAVILSALSALAMRPVVAAADTREHAIVGMPFSGKWGFDVATDKTDDSTGHPSVHRTGDGADEVAMDLYAREDTEVRLYVRDATGEVTISQYTIGGSCGASRGFIVKIDGAVVGRIYVTHLKKAISTEAKVKSGTVIGRVAPKCFEVDHVHFAFNATGGKNTACWVQKATDRNKNGIDVTGNSPIAELGPTNADGNRQRCKPATPGVPACTPTNAGTIKAPWTATDTRGYAVRYRYQYQNTRTGDSQIKTTSSPRSAEFVPGRLGDLYRVRVMAYTEASGTAYQSTDRRPDSGWSAWSARCAARKAPGAPGAPTTEANIDGTITASWNPPASNGAPILEYRVSVRDTMTGTIVPYSAGTGLSYLHTPATASNPLSFSVSARNVAGWGPGSPYSDPVTPEGEPGGAVVGDLDGDGYVGCADKALLLANYGASGPDVLGDLNDDDAVNIFDLSILLSNWRPPPGEPACP